MSRAIRRHHRRRMIARWTRILSGRNVAPLARGTDLDKNARKRAAHPACACGLCRMERVGSGYVRETFDWRSAVAVEG